MDGQVTWSDLGFSFGRTLSEHSAATEEKTSTPCWKKLRVSQNQDFLYLDCRKSGSGQKQEPLTVMGGLSLDELTTLWTGEKPSETAVQEMLSVWGPHSVAEESRLSQIFEVNPLPKYNLTAKACLGILRRAERRGKDLPRRLKAVLLMQSTSGGGCDGGGKGALVQTEKSGTIGIGNDQTIFTAIPINDKATRWQGGGENRNHDGSGNGLGIGKEGDPSPTLTAGDRHGVMCLNDQGGNVMGVSHDVSGTLRAQEHGHQPAVMAFDTTQITSKQNGSIPDFGKPCHTLNANAHVPCAVIRDCGEVVPSLQARMGTGDNQVPLVAYGIGNGQSNEASVMAEEVSQTLNTMHDAQAILYQPKSAMEENWAESETKNALCAGESKVSHAVVCEDVSHALRAKAGCAYREDAETYPVQNMVVRRLTPLECERLQGFPDGWTDIGDYTDSTGKKRKTFDSARYKALGNSIALPFWRWMFGRMAAYLPDGATLGSLFDGIGGFPLCWENIHGAGTAIWASEIEPFPIAVTKKHFPEEK